jgi:hypothetical protein
MELKYADTVEQPVAGDGDMSSLPSFLKEKNKQAS